MTIAYDLTQLDSYSFEHMVNSIAMHVLGGGVSSFSPGADGGRDGYFEGAAPYPNQSEHWSGRWYIQSKFHLPHLTANAQKWLIDQIKQEIQLFNESRSDRIWPDIWIIATNIEPSGPPNTGAFDQAYEILYRARPELVKRFHIWGGAQIATYLHQHPDVAARYGHFLTPGNVIRELYDYLKDDRASIRDILRELTVTQFTEQQYTKLEQAGSTTDSRPGIHKLFTDVPFISRACQVGGYALQFLARASATNQCLNEQIQPNEVWRAWKQHPARARVWFIKGGPGHGKSTLGQYLCQIQRAAILLGPDAPNINATQRALAEEIEQAAKSTDCWPIAPRVPVAIDLKAYAQWFGRLTEENPRGVLSYLSDRLSQSLEQQTNTGTLKRAFEHGRWMFVFDGLDEVSADIKTSLSVEIVKFVNDVLVGCECDALIICTSRPQGYAGQLSELDAAIIELPNLSPEQALACAKPVLGINRSDSEASSYFAILKEALESPSVREIMATPLQAHIMAVVVRDGGRPPERKWALYSNFYNTVKKREANKLTHDKRLAALIREDDRLLKSLHNRLGFELHARAERSDGVQTSLEREEFRKIVAETVSKLQDTDIADNVGTLMEATTDRLVLVSTPESGSLVRFDVRPLQEFFAAEYIYESVNVETLEKRLSQIASDAHWREVMHFLLSALIENSRQSELSIATQVLCNSNTGGQDGPSAFLYRRLATGAIISSRILNEGVLEQDKRVRNQFRNALEPLTSITDSRYLIELSTIRGVQSRAWLLDELVTSLSTLAAAENIGGSVILSHALPNGHPRIKEVLGFLNNAEPDYLSTLFQLCMEQDPYSEDRIAKPPLKQWFVSFAFRLLLTPTWLELSPHGLGAALHIVFRDKVMFESSAIENGLTQELALWLIEIFDEAPGRGITDKNTTFIETFGPLEARYLKPTPESDYRYWPSQRSEELKTSGGILEVIFLLGNLARAPSRESFDALHAALKGDFSLLTQFTGSIAGLVPNHHWDRPPKNSREINDWLQYCNREPRLFGCVVRLTLSGNSSSKIREWSSLISKHLSIAFRIFSDPSNFLVDHRRRRGGLMIDSPGVCELLIHALIASPSILFYQPEAWAKLFKAGTKQRTKIRAIIRENARTAVLKSELFSFGDMSTFELKLPEEADMIPHLLNAIVSTHIRNKFDLGRLRRYYEPPRSEIDIKTMLKEFVRDPSALLLIAQGDESSKATAGAAAICYLLHPLAHRAEFPKCTALICDSYNQTHGYWYLRAAALGLEEAILANNAQALSCFGRLLQASANDFAARISLNPVVESWRQKSHSPIFHSEEKSVWGSN